MIRVVVLSNFSGFPLTWTGGTTGGHIVPCLAHEIEWTNNRSLSTGFAFTNATQDTIWLSWCPATPPTDVHLPVHHNSPRHFSRIVPQPVLSQEINPSPVPYFPLIFIKSYKFISSPIFEPTDVSPYNGSSFPYIYLSSQLDDICRLDKGEFNPDIQITYKGFEKYWTQYRSFI